MTATREFELLPSGRIKFIFTQTDAQTCEILSADFYSLIIIMTSDVSTDFLNIFIKVFLNFFANFVVQSNTKIII